MDCYTTSLAHICGILTYSLSCALQGRTGWSLAVAPTHVKAEWMSITKENGAMLDIPAGLTKTVMLCARAWTVANPEELNLATWQTSQISIPMRFLQMTFSVMGMRKTSGIAHFQDGMLSSLLLLPNLMSIVLVSIPLLISHDSLRD